MTSEKKITVIRILIFTAISYGIVIACVSLFGYLQDTISGNLSQLAIAFAPAIANYLTRLITKEGFMDPLYAANFRGNIRYYVIAAAVPIIAFIISPIIAGNVMTDNYSLSKALNGDTAAEFTCIILQIVSLSALMFPLYFGEEYGWRAYLTPKLESVMKKPAAIIVSGIIWGMWHAPLVYFGHNFGTEYSLYPWGGYAMMCVLCIFMGCLLTWLTERTGSIYPACICHAVHNNIANTMSAFFLAESMTEKFFLAKQFEISSILLLVMSAFCIPSAIMLLCSRKKA
ncbi:MAG: CPBP family intramembrane metalloprotease [Oscillospiraceae bacterium]|nr:CPBP family intramembrane metalloprotease [Oscillospiraceae bacterium]